VALAASMKHIFCGQAGETYFSTSDIGWVVGHSYIVYGPLIAGMATILYEGLPIRPDAAIWWSLVEKYKVSVMFSAPTAVRVLKKQDPAALKRHDLSSLRALFLAGEPLDETTASGSPRPWQAGRRQLLADRNRLADPDHRQRRREGAKQVRLAGRADVRRSTSGCSTRTPARS
jgi:acyl-CoA synthetase (AMP-forming)/AMP-acid ligase II